MAAAKSNTSAAVRIRKPESCLYFIFGSVPPKIFNLKMFSIYDLVKKEVRPSSLVSDGMGMFVLRMVMARTLEQLNPSLW